MLGSTQETFHSAEKRLLRRDNISKNKAVCKPQGSLCDARQVTLLLGYLNFLCQRKQVEPVIPHFSPSLILGGPLYTW